MLLIGRDVVKALRLPKALPVLVFVLGLFVSCFTGFPGLARGESCAEAVQKLNRKLNPQIDEGELVSILRTLNVTNNRKLPAQFVTKRQAKKAGWRPGTDLWSYGELRGKSIGGDVFKNRERKLPNGRRTWREADLDYKGGRRGAKRLIFSKDGLRHVTVDHYSTYAEVPSCQ